MTLEELIVFCENNHMEPAGLEILVQENDNRAGAVEVKDIWIELGREENRLLIKVEV